LGNQRPLFFRLELDLVLSHNLYVTQEMVSHFILFGMATCTPKVDLTSTKLSASRIGPNMAGAASL
jgi:hypothetical protein